MSWNAEQLVYLNEIARRLVFDWNEVAKVLKQTYPDESDLINATTCREQFAATNHIDITGSSSIPSPIMTNSNHQEYLQQLEGLTIEQLIEHVDKREEEIRLKKENIFQRVLTSLGGTVGSSHELHDAATIAFIDANQRMAQQRSKLLENQKEQKERETLRLERERLRRRFEPDSVDAIGEDPLPLSEIETSPTSTNPIEPEPIKLDLESLVDNDIFDTMLSELEQELSSLASAKDDQAAPSELGEIISFLEEAAKSNNSRKLSSSADQSQSNNASKSTMKDSTTVISTVHIKNALANLASPPPPPQTEVRQVNQANELPPLPTKKQDHTVKQQRGGERMQRDDTRGRIEDEDELEVDEEDENYLWAARRKQMKNRPQQREAVELDGVWKGYGQQEGSKTQSTTLIEQEDSNKLTQFDLSSLNETAVNDEVMDRNDASSTSNIDSKPMESEETNQFTTFEENEKTLVDEHIITNSYAMSSIPIPTLLSTTSTMFKYEPTPDTATVPKSTNIPPKTAAKPQKMKTFNRLTRKNPLVSQEFLSEPAAGADSNPPIDISAPALSKKASEPVADLPSKQEEIEYPMQEAEVPPTSEGTNFIKFSLEGTLQAPWLYPLPADKFNDKVHRTVIRIPKQSQTEGDNEIVDLSSVLLVSFYAAERNINSLYWLVRGLECIVRQSSDRLNILSCQLLSEPSKKLQVIFQKKQVDDDTSTEEWKQLFQTMNLLDQQHDHEIFNDERWFMPAKSQHVDLKECWGTLDVLDYLTNPEQLNQAISLLLQPISPHIQQYQLIKHQLFSMISCVLKDYTWDELGNGLLSYLVFIIEREGYHLTGLRSLFVKNSEITALKTFTSSELSNYYSTTSHHTINSNRGFLPALVLAMAWNGDQDSAAEQLRQLLGPEDPALARKTDPKSLRAIFGKDRGLNACYPIPHSSARLTNDLSVWFGPREADLSSPSPSSLILPPKIVQVTLGIRFMIEYSCLTSKSAIQLYKLQNIVLQSLLSKLLHYGTLLEYNTVAVSSYIATLFNASSLMCTYEDERQSQLLNPSSQCWIVKVITTANAVYLHHLWCQLIRTVKQAGSDYSLHLFLDVDHHFHIDSPTVFSQYNQQLSSSKLLALEASKLVSDNDLKSHEDVGLADICLIAFTPSKSSVPTTSTIHLQLEHAIMIMIEIMNRIPSSCACYIMAAKVGQGSDESGPDAIFCLRGHHLLEVIDTILSEVKKLPTLTATPKHHYSMDYSFINHTKFMVYKGRKALEKIFLTLPWDHIYTDLSILDLHEFVPKSYLNKAPPSLQTLISDSQSMSSSSFTTEQMVQTLFHPGRFYTPAIIVISQTTLSMTIYMQIITRTMNRLEREDFEVIAMKCINNQTLTNKIRNLLQQDNMKVFEYNQEWIKSEDTHHDDVDDQCSCSSDSSRVCLIVVKRLSALFRLKSLIGPSLDYHMASQQYPRSLNAVIHSLLPPAPSETTTSFPWLMASLTIHSMEVMMNKYFPEICQALLNVEQGQDSTDLHHHLRYGHREETSQDDLVWFSASNIMLSYMDIHPSFMQHSQDYVVKIENKPSSEPSTFMMMDLAGIVITSRLIHYHRGLSVILEALQREGLWIVNALTTKLSMSLAKQLLEVAGASSLTMKPSLDDMLSGPVVCLGLCGPNHAFVRLKSFTTSSGYARTGLNDATQSLWSMEYGAGVLASSSPRLARDLYGKIFDSIYGTEIPFTISLELKKKDL